MGVGGSAEKSTDSTNGNSGTNRATIGSTTISTQQAEMIREEVRQTVARAFPGTREKLLQEGSPSLGSPEKGSRKTLNSVIDLIGSTS